MVDAIRDISEPWELIIDDDPHLCRLKYHLVGDLPNLFDLDLYDIATLEPRGRLHERSNTTVDISQAQIRMQSAFFWLT